MKRRIVAAVICSAMLSPSRLLHISQIYNVFVLPRIISLAITDNVYVASLIPNFHIRSNYKIGSAFRATILLSHFSNRSTRSLQRMRFFPIFVIFVIHVTTKPRAPGRGRDSINSIRSSHNHFALVNFAQWFKRIRVRSCLIHFDRISL